MGNGKRTITIGTAAAVALLSFGAGVYFAVDYGSAPADRLPGYPSWWW